MKILLALFFSLLSFAKLASESKVLLNPTYELLSSSWSEIEQRWRRYTTEDKISLQIFAENYAQKSRLLFLDPPKALRIPRVMHFIWVGPKPFPKESIDNLKAWRKLHPDWRMLFWTDSEERSCPIHGMEKHLISEIEFQMLDGFLERTTNYGEKADIIRYELLYQQGGVYIDHDVLPYRSFDTFHSLFDFYVGLENPHTNPGTKTKVFPCNCLFAARPFHPIIKRTMEHIIKRWDAVEKAYPAGSDLKINKNRVLNRTFHSFTLATKECLNQDGNNDIVFPSSFFFAYKIFSRKDIQKLMEKGLVYARHDFSSAWTDLAPKKKVSKKSSKKKKVVTEKKGSKKSGIII